MTFVVVVVFVFKVTSGRKKWGVRKPGELVHIINAIKKKLFYILSNEHSCKGENTSFILRFAAVFLVLFGRYSFLQENS